MTAASLSRIVMDHAAATPNAPFLQPRAASPFKFTYRDLTAMVTELCALFERYNVKPGGTVALVGSGHWLFHPILVACAAYQAVLVPINGDRPGDELKRILLSACPRLVISENLQRLPKPNGGQNYLGIEVLVEHLVAALPSAGTGPGFVDRSDPRAVVIMPYSFGMSGRLNGVMITQDNLVAAAQALVRVHEVTASDVIACTPGYHHILHIMLGAVMPLYAGASVVLSEHADSIAPRSSGSTPTLQSDNENRPLAYWNDVDTSGATICVLKPTLMAALLQASTAGAPPRKLRFGLCGGGVLTKGLWKRFEDHFGVMVHLGYGLSETTGWVTCTSRHGSRNSIGRPLDCEIRIHAIPNLNSDEFSYDRRHTWRPEHSLNPRQGPLGEIQVKGRTVMAGYFKNPKGTHEQITNDGFLRTGDIGFIDPEGDLHFVGRLKDTIVRGGHTVYPRHIERAAETHELVAECKTIGIPDINANQRLVCCCVPKVGDAASFPADEVLKWLEQRLPPHEVPDKVVALAHLPRSSGGGVSTATLRGITTGRATESIIENLARPKYSKSPPSDIPAIKAIVDRAIIMGHPLRFLCFWGAGHRNAVGSVDEDAMLRLFAYLRTLEVIPRLQATLTMILHDIHAKVNRVDPAVSQPYFRAIETLAQSHGFGTVWMSDIWREAGLTLDDAFAAARRPEFVERWNALPIRTQLISQAVKYGRDKTVDPEEQARMYLASCVHESKVLAAMFPDHVFLTYTTPEMDPCLPALPKSYLYSSRKWNSSRPWFSD